MKLAVDGTNLARRFWHATGGHTDAAANALKNYLQYVTDITHIHAVTVAFDGDNANAPRRLIDPSYKATRRDNPEARQAVTSMYQALVDAHWPCDRQPEVEADDILAAHAQQAREHDPVTLLTSDKDAWALLSHHVSVLLPTRPPQPVTEKHIRHKLGIGASSYRLYSALVGDPSDNIQGVPGIGPKTASVIANTYTLEQFTDALASNSVQQWKDLLGSRHRRISDHPQQVLLDIQRNDTLTRPQPVTAAECQPPPMHN